MRGAGIDPGARFDDSTLHDTQWSPRVAVVYTPAPHHSFRAAANRGFQVGNYTELFLNVPAAPPVDLSAIEAALAPVLNGVPLGLESVPIFAIGNSDLDVEKITSFEVGYAATYSRGRVSIDVYRNRMRDFISDLLFGVNPAYPPYQAPAALPPASREIVEATLNGLVPGLTNAANGAAESLQVAKRQLQLMETQLQRFLRAGKPVADGPARSFDLTPVVEDVLALVRPAAKHVGAEIRWTPPAGEVVVRADREALAQVVLNLLLNAVEAVQKTPHGTPRSIRASLSGVNARASATFSSTCATESQPMITVLIGNDSV